MSAEDLIVALKAKRVGRTWLARCPAHHDRTPSLSISRSATGKVLVHCHAGCTQQQVVAALKEVGLWAARCEGRDALPARRKPDVEVAHGRPDRGAMAIWSASHPAPGTLVDDYLRSRGLTVAPPGSLRFHPNLKHPSGTRWPAMIALVTGAVSGEPVAVHRTFLMRDGASKAPVEPQKMMLGSCRGGNVRLAVPGNTLMVGEGIETCLSVMQLTGTPAWAALSTSGLRALDLPDDIQEVVVLADGDDAGEAAARACAHRWSRKGRVVTIERPPPGLDFNDVLLGRHLTDGASA